MKLKSFDLPKRISAGDVPVAVLLFGQDQGLVEESAAMVRQRLFEEAQAEFNLELFFGGDLQAERFLNSCQAYPFLASRRLVILKEADRLSTTNVKTVTNYLKRPSPSTLLLVLAGNLEAKSPLRKQFETDKTAWCIPFYPLEGRALRQWLETQLRQDGFRVDTDVFPYLTEHLAGDTRNTRQELDKLRLFMGHKKQIALEDVLAMVGTTTTYSGFGLSAAVTSGQLPEALAILEKLLESGEEPILLLGTLSQRIRRLNQCNELLSEGMATMSVAAKLNIFWKDQELFFQQSRHIPARKLADGLLDCLEADRQLKGGSDASPRHIMERLVMRLVAHFRKTGVGLRR